MDIAVDTPEDATALPALIRRAANADDHAHARPLAWLRTTLVLRLLRPRPDGSPGQVTAGPADDVAARAQHEAFRQGMLAGPTEADRVCRLRGLDFTRILDVEYGVHDKLQGVYNLLHRLNLSGLNPRPKHRISDPQAMQAWAQVYP